MIIPTAASKVAANSSKISTLLRTVGDEINEISSALGEVCRRIKESRIKELKQENEKLQKQIEVCSRELRDLRSVKGIPLISLSAQSTSDSSTPSTSTSKATNVCSKIVDVTRDESAKLQANEGNEQIAKKKLGPSKNKNTTNSGVQPEKEEPHIGRLDIRVGKIVDVQKHPNADALYVEKVDIGEEKPRTIISGLVKHVPIEQMRNRIALFLVNLKPVKMRGIDSEGMIMCGGLEDKVEILVPPEGVQPGEFVTVDGYERKPDAQLNAKKKIFERVQVDMKTNEKREATYKGIPWNVAGRGVVLSPTLINASIR